MSAFPAETARAARPGAAAPPGGREEALPDAPARQRIASDLDTTLVVEAAAGTGKTTALVSRVVELVRSGRANMAGVVAITFTQRAAGDLRLRIRQGLEAEIAKRPAPAEARRMEEAMGALEEASIGTIHAFCSALLRERPLPAGVDPDFRVLTGAEQAAFFEPLFREYLRRQLEDPAPGVARLLRRNRDARADPVRLLRSAAFRLLEHRDLDAPWSRPRRDAGEAVRRLLYEDELDERDTRITGASLSTLAAAHRLLPPETPGQRPNWLVRSMADAAELERDIAIRKETGRWDHDWVEQALATLQIREYGGRPPDRDTGAKLLRAFPRLPVKIVRGEMQVDLKGLREGFRARLERFREEAGADLAALLREDLRPLLGAYERTTSRGGRGGRGDREEEEAARTAAREADEGAEKRLTGYEEAKRAAGRLDFEDLLLRARDLLRDDPGARSELRSRFTHILVDEYQDTDPVQTEILFLLTAAEAPPDGDWLRAVPAPGRLFLVGDPKQSIYRFRRADVRHYLEVKKRLLARGAAEVRLTTNFRSVPEVCDFVNGVFEPLFGAAGGARASEEAGDAGAAASGESLDRVEREEDPRVTQVEYAPIEAWRDPVGNRAAVRAIPVPDDGDLARNEREIEGAEPAAVARFVERLLKSGLEVSDRRAPRRPVEPSDICLLFRRFLAFGRLIPQAYADALQQRDIPQALAAIPSYTGSAEIRAMRAALTAVEFPDDELQVYAALRGPLFAFSDEELFLYRERGQRLCPGAPGPLPETADASDRAIRNEIAFLDRLHRERNRRPVSRTIQDLLSRHRAETAFAFRKSADQVLANLRRLTQSAREFEAGGGLSLRAFVRRLDDEANDADYGAMHAFDPDVRGVRFSTVHSAKGLEFPVVVLVDSPCRREGRAQRVARPKEKLHACDLGDGIRPLELLRARKTEEEEDLLESDRALYVAATRARDLLVAVSPAARYGMETSWLRPVYDRLPEPDEDPGSRVRETPEESLGAARPRSGDSLPADPTARRWRLLSGDAAEDDDGGFGAFLERRAKTLARGRVRSQPVARADRYARREFSPDEVAIHQLPRAPGRPRGAAFGELVHRILERASLDGAEEEAPGRLAPLLAAEYDLDEALAAPAAAAAEAALDHEVLRSARRAAARGACYREFPTCLREDRPAPEEPGAPNGAEADSGANGAETNDALLIEGKVDLLFQAEEGAPWTVVEFKTGSQFADAATSPEAGAALDRYRRQATIYARAVSRATGEPAQPVLLFL